MAIYTITRDLAAAYDKIRAIKALRNLTGYGLKESKDLIDAADGRVMKFETSTSDEQLANWNTTSKAQLMELGYAGYSVQLIGASFCERIKDLACEAIQSNEYGLAHDLLDLLQRRYGSTPT